MKTGYETNPAAAFELMHELMQLDQRDTGSVGHQHHYGSGQFFVEREILTDGSEVFDVMAHPAGDPSTCIRVFHAVDEADAIARCDALNIAVQS